MLDSLFVVVGRVENFIRRRVNRAVSRKLTSRFAECGLGVELKGKATVSAPEKVRCGANVHIGDNAYIRAEGGLTIGDNTHISRNLVLYTCNHDYEGELLPYDERLTLKPVEIGRNVWIGMNVCIAPGATIGDGAIIGMGAVVSGVVEPLTIVASQPLRQIGRRDEQRYHELEGRSAYSGAAGRPR